MGHEGKRIYLSKYKHKYRSENKDKCSSRNNWWRALIPPFFSSFLVIFVIYTSRKLEQTYSLQKSIIRDKQILEEIFQQCPWVQFVPIFLMKTVKTWLKSWFTHWFECNPTGTKMNFLLCFSLFSTHPKKLFLPFLLICLTGMGTPEMSINSDYKPTQIHFWHSLDLRVVIERIKK